MAVAATAVQIGSFVFQLIRFLPLLPYAGLQCSPRGTERRAVIGIEKMRSGGSKEKLSRSPWLVKAGRLRRRQAE
jgi:hypothetical protein